MEFEEIKCYWDNRAAKDSSGQSTTQDHYLREIECRVIAEQIAAIKPRRVIDIGCGDARTTVKLARKFPTIEFTGADYSQSMIGNARHVIKEVGAGNVVVTVADVSAPLEFEGFDLAYTSRCLINLPSWNLQKKAIANIRETLTERGYLILVENFVEGQNNFNMVRETFGLQPIGIRDHNKFFKTEKLRSYVLEAFDIIHEENISSTYYLMSRVIYSKICADRNERPDYFDAHHRYAAGLPFCGEYGPVRMLVLRRI